MFRNVPCSCFYLWSKRNVLLQNLIWPDVIMSRYVKILVIYTLSYTCLFSCNASHALRDDPNNGCEEDYTCSSDQISYVSKIARYKLTMLFI